MVRLSDARMSGTAFGTIVLHMTPEAAIGGPLALVRDGDSIRLDVAARRLDLLVDDAELEQRRAALPAVSTGAAPVPDARLCGALPPQRAAGRRGLRLRLPRAGPRRPARPDESGCAGLPAAAAGGAGRDGAAAGELRQPLPPVRRSGPLPARSAPQLHAGAGHARRVPRRHEGMRHGTCGVRAAERVRQRQPPAARHAARRRRRFPRRGRSAARHKRRRARDAACTRRARHPPQPRQPADARRRRGRRDRGADARPRLAPAGARRAARAGKRRAARAHRRAGRGAGGRRSHGPSGAGRARARGAAAPARRRSRLGQAVGAVPDRPHRWAAVGRTCCRSSASLADTNPERLVWGSDWPHSELFADPPSDADLVGLLPQWLPDEGLRRRVCAENPARLYDFPATAA